MSHKKSGALKVEFNMLEMLSLPEFCQTGRWGRENIEAQKQQELIGERVS